MALNRNDGLVEMRRRLGLVPTTGKAGEVTCLKCERRFKSEDRFRIRVCSHCKGGDAWKSQGIATSSTQEKVRLGG